MTARDVFWVAGELAGADFVHPAAGDALDGKTSGSQLSHKFRMRAERHDVVTFQGLLLQRKTPSTMEAVYRPLCHASASSVAARPVPRQSERCVKSRPLRQLHRWHSGIIGHGRTDWMKSDNCRVHPALTRKHPGRGGGKGGRGGQRDRQPRPARFRALPGIECR